MTLNIARADRAHLLEAARQMEADRLLALQPGVERWRSK
ncbi:hypothetical protein QFZ74_005128 [Streptomyces sp. V3I7]|nr:hypothetical protein [Streptomyces sp. V3I7]